MRSILCLVSRSREKLSASHKSYAHVLNNLHSMRSFHGQEAEINDEYTFSLEIFSFAECVINVRDVGSYQTK